MAPFTTDEAAQRCMKLLAGPEHAYNVRIFRLPQPTLAWCGAGKTGTTTIFQVLHNAARQFQPEYADEVDKVLHT